MHLIYCQAHNIHIKQGLLHFLQIFNTFQEFYLHLKSCAHSDSTACLSNAEAKKKGRQPCHAGHVINQATISETLLAQFYHLSSRSSESLQYIQKVQRH